MIPRYALIALTALVPLVLADVSVKGPPSRATPVASPVAMACEDIYGYAVETRTLLPDLSFTPPDDDDLSSLRPSQLRELADVLDTWGGALDAYPLDDVPDDAMVFHDARVDQVTAAAGVTNALAQGSPLGALIYTDTLQESVEIANGEAERIHAVCGFDVRFPER